MNPQLPVVAIILHFRTPELTLNCLESLLNNGLTKVIIVDNSEDDRTSLAEMANGLQSIEQRGLQVTLIEPGRNLGFAGGVNVGVQHVLDNGLANVLLLNSDVRLMPKAFEALSNAVDIGANVAVPTIISKNENLCPGNYSYHRWLALFLRKPWYGSLNYPSGACLLLSKDTLLPQLLDSDFFFFGEDVAFGNALKLADASIANVSKAKVWHEESASAHNGSLFYEYHMVRGHWLLARKLARGKWEMTISLAGRCITLPARALVRSLRKWQLIPLIGFAMATLDVFKGRCHTLTPPCAHKSSKRVI